MSTWDAMIDTMGVPDTLTFRSIRLEVDPQHGFRLVNDAGGVVAYTSQLVATEEVMLHLDATRPLSPSERAAALARLDRALSP